MECMPGDGEPSDEDRESVPKSDVLNMIADDLDQRATTLQNESKRLDDDAEQLREMAQSLDE